MLDAEAGAPDVQLFRSAELCLHAVIQLELQRMRGHAHLGDFLHLQRDVGVDHIVSEHAAGLEEAAVG